MLRTLVTTESTLTKLCNSKNWEQVKQHAQSSPEEAKPNSSAYRGVGSTALSIAVRGGAPIDTIVSLIEANVEQLVRVRHSRRGTVIHEAIKHRASMQIIFYLIQRMARYEKERRWIIRGELQPLSFEFEPISGMGSEKNVGVSIIPNSERKQEFTSFLSPNQFHTHTTLFNTTDDLGRTILHCIVGRACHDVNLLRQDEAISVIKEVLYNFPPAVGKRDSDGKTPLELVLMTQNQQNSNSVIDMEVELKVLQLVRLMLDAYPLAACVSINSAHAIISPRNITDALVVNEVNCDSYSARVMNRRRIVMNSVDGNIGQTPLSFALMYGRHFSTVQLLLKASKLAQTSWYTGHFLDWDNPNQNRCNVDNLSCMAIVSSDHEVPLHVAVTMRASEDIVSLLLDSCYQAGAVTDRCGLTPICWVWIRFVIDINNRGELGGDLINDPRRQLRVRVSNRRFIPTNYVQLHEAVTKEISNSMKDIKDVSHSNRTRHPSSLLINSALDNTELWNKLAVLLPCAAKATEANSSKTSLSICVGQNNWSPLHAASFISCPRAVLLLALEHLPNEVKKKDVYGNLPIHYATARQGYTRNVPIGATLVAKEIIERSALFDLLPLWPKSASVTNANKQLPLHLAIDEEKQSHLLERGGRRKSLSEIEAQIMASPVLCLLLSYPEALYRRDGVTKLYPFMQAAVGDGSSLNMTFMLLKENPAIISNCHY